MRFEAHLDECDGCVAYLSQIRILTRLSSAARESAVTTLAATLLPAFRTFRRAHPDNA